MIDRPTRAKLEGLRRAEALGLPVPPFDVVDLGDGSALAAVLTRPLPLIMRNAPAMAWEDSDAVSGIGTSFRCTTRRELEQAVARMQRSENSVAIVQRLVQASTAGFLFTIQSQRCTIAGLELTGAVSFAAGTSDAIAAGTATRPPHFYVVGPTTDRRLVTCERCLADVKGLGAPLVSSLQRTLDLLTTDVHDFEVEWVWDGSICWVVQLQPFDLVRTRWPYTEMSVRDD